MSDGALNPVRWLGSSLKDLRSFPPEVRSSVGQAIYTARRSLKDPAAKPMKGFEASTVMEIVAFFHGDTWRAVYTVRLKGFIYVTSCISEEIQVRDRYTKKEIDLIRRPSTAAYED
jgi:phage-related protein